MLDRVPGAAPEVEASATGYAGDRRPNGRQAAALGGKFEPYELPILNAHPYQPDRPAATPTARAASSATRSAQGLAARPGARATRPTRVSDLPGSRGPTTLFYNDAGERELRDTRVASRQPETWESGQ